MGTFFLSRYFNFFFELMKKQIIFQSGQIGILFEENTITKVFPKSQAGTVGVRVGWTILEVNGERQSDNHESIAQAINKAQGTGKPMMILFQEEERSNLKSLRKTK